MAYRKMTFSIPEKIADLMVRRVPARDRSRYVAEAIALRLEQREQALIRACEIANLDPDVVAIEEEWDTLRDPVDGVNERWNSTS